MLTLNPTTTGARHVIAPFAVIQAVGDVARVAEFGIVNVARVVQATGDGAESVQIHIRSAASDIVVLSDENFATIAAAQRSFSRNATAADKTADVAWSQSDDQHTRVDRVWQAEAADPADANYFEAHCDDVVDVSYGEDLWTAWL